jgi:nucleotidyltransferase substrate binding protein (TIGR01987 family)
VSRASAAFARSVVRLEEALREPSTPIVRDACIQRFEFCFELAWKAIQESLRSEGRECTSPRSCFREAFKQGWIESEEAWTRLLADRNLTSHTYDEALAEAVYGRLESHRMLLASLRERLPSE